MGTNGEFDIDAGNGDGKFLIDDNGKFMICDNCCEGPPCTDCASSEPDAEVVVSGLCGGLDFGGNYTFLAFWEDDPEFGCTWQLQMGEDGPWLLIEYHGDTETWYGLIVCIPHAYFGGALTAVSSSAGP